MSDLIRYTPQLLGNDYNDRASMYEDEDGLYCLYEDIAELESDLSRKSMSLADTEALLMGAEERLRKKEADLALKDKVVQVLAEEVKLQNEYNCEFKNMSHLSWIMWATAKAKEQS